MLDTFGSLADGRPVHRVVLGREPGAQLHLLTLGSTVHRLIVAGGDGVRRDLVLGYPDVASYVEGGDYVGAVVGRYANRIAGGRFELDGEVHLVGTNDRGNSLHGGPDGFDERLWDLVEMGPDEKRPTYAVLCLDSPDGDQGFPGAVEVEARWEVDDHTVRLTLTATTDRATVVNLSTHAYFNLDGAGTVDDHELRVPASAFVPVDETGVPLREHAAVDGTPFDLREPRRLGEVARDPHPQVVAGQGIDHDLVVDGEGERVLAELTSARTRTRLRVLADQPGLQVYTGNFLDGSAIGRDGALLRQGDGIALEPQLHPDTPHHEGEPGWPSAVVRPGETYRTSIAWELSAL